MAQPAARYQVHPFFGFRRMRASLERQGMVVGWNRVQRLMRTTGLRTIYRDPRASRPAPEQRVYPYLLRNAQITQPTRCGRRTSPTCPCPGASSTWWPSWTGTAGARCPGGCPTLWRQTSASRLAGGAGSGPVGGVQHRPGQPVHQPGVHPVAAIPPGEDQHGWEGTLPRQHLRGAVGAHREVRRKATLEPLDLRAESETDLGILTNGVATAGSSAATPTRKPTFLQREEGNSKSQAQGDVASSNRAGIGNPQSHHKEIHVR